MKPLALVVENDGGTRKLLDVLLTRYGLEGRVIGAAGWSFRERRVFSESEKRTFLSVAKIAAEAIGDNPTTTQSTTQAGA